ncbi:MAG: hypothetical protein ACFCVG_01140 [Kineosporiaceae bacterium]
MSDELSDLRLLRAVRTDLTRRLVAWGVVSVAGGTVLAAAGAVRGQRVLAGVGRQAVAWGAVDLVIAGVGSAANRRPVTDAPRAVRSLRRLLLGNAVLDMGYLAGAAVLARRPERAGDALGVAVQAVALLVLDVGHAVRLGSGRRG